MTSKRFFTLVELIVVIAIVALLSALVIPNLLRSRLNANENIAQATLKTLATQAATFSVQNGDYPVSLAQMADASPPFIDNTLSDENGPPEKQGYAFTYANNDANGDINGFWTEASPITAGISGNAYFYIDESNVICKGAAAAAGHSFLNQTCPAGFVPVQ